MVFGIIVNSGRFTVFIDHFIQSLKQFIMTGKVYIVTGSTGIAADTILLLLKEGNHVFYVDKNVFHCEQLLEVINYMGYDADYMVGNLSNERFIKELVTSCVNIHGRIDGLFNVAESNAEKFGDGPLHQCTLTGWQSTLRNNLTVQSQICKSVINVMMDQEPDEDGIRGAIVNMNNVFAFSAEPDHLNSIAYATSRGSIISMTKTEAAYYAKNNIRINTITPGIAIKGMDTEIAENDSLIEFFKEKQALVCSFLSDTNVAEEALFLLGNQSLKVSRQTLVLEAV
jgi:NAD(P)-dependent dehydrogenase (short-subunit alcohol dehydrogenase family)